MPVSCICGIVGALSISSFPLTSGFTAKSMITSAAGEEHLLFVWLALAAASAGVFLHAGIKFPWFVFFQKDSGLRPDDPPWNMRWAMILMSVACILFGVWWHPLYAMLPYPADYFPYKADKVLQALQLLLFSGLAFFLMLGALKRTLTITLDVDWVWRKLGKLMAEEFELQWLRAYKAVGAQLYGSAMRFLEGLYRTHGPEGALSRTRPSGYMALWMTVLLSLFLLLSFL
jgi:multicomponent Na+:H+ antiporter subunit D